MFSNNLKIKKLAYFFNKQYFSLKLFLYFSTIFISSNIEAQELLFEYLTVGEGLPHNRVQAIEQDKNGLLWFGTQEGLVRYDGYECRIFRQKELVGFRGKMVECIKQDSKGNIWVGMQADGVNIRDAKTGKFWNLGQKKGFERLAQTRVHTIFEDQKGIIWIGTIENGLFAYYPDNQTLKHFDKHNSTLQDNTISAIKEDANGNLWIASGGKYIYEFEASIQHFNPIRLPFLNNSDFIGFRKSFFIDAQQNLWIGTEGGGLYRLHLPTRQFERMMPQNKGLSSVNILSIAQIENEKLLLATDGGGLNIFDPQTGKVEWYKYDIQQHQTLNTNQLYTIFIDRQKNIWIGTINGGVNIFKANRTRFKNFKHSGNKTSELSHRSVLSLYEAKDHKLWIGTDGGGIDILDPQTFSFSKFIPTRAIGSGVVKCIFEDSKQRMWFGYFNDGVDVYDANRRFLRRYRSDEARPNSISGTNVWSIAEDYRHRLWFGTQDDGLNLWDEAADTFRHFKNEPNNIHSLPDNRIIFVYADRKKNLWIGSENGGLCLWDTVRQHFIRYQHQSDDPLSIGANDVRCVFEDSKGRLWVGTESGGLNLWLGNGQFKRIRASDGLRSDAISSIIEDKSGALWVATFKGIVRFEVEKTSFQFFDFSHGNNYNQFNPLASLCSSQEILFFGGINGLNIIKPEWVRIYEQKPPIVLTDFKIFNKSVIAGRQENGRTVLEKSIEIADKIYLAYNENVISFEFAALDFTDPFWNQYAYRLEGFDVNWQYTNAEKRTVTYTNLNPGRYTFKVKGTNSVGVWSDEKRIEIIIEPPFWATWWFRGWMLLLGGGLLWVGLRIYTTRREMGLEQRVLQSEKEILRLTNDKLASEVNTKNSELMSKAAQMAHKITILSSIKDQLEVIRQATETEKEKLLRGMKNTIEHEIEDSKAWEQFTMYFDEINHNFSKEILKQHPDLTPNDLRICVLLRLNLSTKEIAALLNISKEGVEKGRYRLKKRLGLGAEESLYDYLRKY